MRVVLILGLTAVKATQFWHNTRTKARQDNFTHKHKSTVDEATDRVCKSSTALRMTRIYDPGYRSRCHSEAVKNNVYRKGDHWVLRIRFSAPGRLAI
ncbi:hypothetical protein F4774DRAFT_387931 [Daldinia eschscholtzii]|nr:hypothetical protein F4774DRAFT_387931 [Daldinia eschscholtzii]